jgi:hypothetical protein
VRHKRGARHPDGVVLATCPLPPTTPHCHSYLWGRCPLFCARARPPSMAMVYSGVGPLFLYLGGGTSVGLANQ